jgi:hypothetical protein
MKSEEMTVEEWVATRKEEGLKIDSSTAEVEWCYAQVLDPYGIHPDLPDECDCVGRAYFARRPASAIWVHFDDLPEGTREALWERYSFRLAFPAGLEGLLDLLDGRDDNVKTDPQS